MEADWIASPMGRRIVGYWADPRPAWLWSRDGKTLLWRNAAARLFNARIKKGSLRLAPDPMPIKGLVARLIRLGAPGRSSLSRVQFLSGGKPVAATCSSTPLILADGETGLLLAHLDPVAAEVLEAGGPPISDPVTAGLLPAGTSYALVRDGTTIEGTIPPDGEPMLRLPADTRGAELVLYPAAPTGPSLVPETATQEGAAAGNTELDLADTPEPLLPLGLAPLPEPISPLSPVEPSAGDWNEPSSEPAEHTLSSLFDRLADDAGLYTALTAEDERLGAPVSDDPVTPAALVAGDEPDLIAAVIEYADDPEAPPPAAASSPSHWMITGRGFRALTPDPQTLAEGGPESASEAPIAATVDAAPDAEAAKRVSRYNFEELGRILSDRVAAEDTPTPFDSTSEPRPTPQGVINLSAETLVLNRLPLSILVFRDQQVLFANRALTDLLGYDGVASLRSAGIASIFPSEDSGNAGPVNRLIRRDGTALAVTARLQSVSWQGRAALMLSASSAEAARGHEGAVRVFVKIAADARQEGFVIADRAGLVTEISPAGAAALGSPGEDILGRPLAVLVAASDMEPMRAFLEKPARFAETARPSLVAASESGQAEIALFAEGQAGLVTGYFGFVRKRSAAPSTTPEQEPSDPMVFGRLSRGIRRPLNTIIGFADLIRSAATGSIDAARYVEYARDIRTAGLEIAVLVDELDDYSRLRDGDYEVRPSDVELGALLESCVQRVKSQASAARVLVRSAVAESLPRVRADRASLGQALLNLLASAIDQTTIGGSVIISAQIADDGGVAVHVRDGSQNTVDLAERFLVFRDGIDKDGEQLQPVRSSVGLALTRSLLAVNACTLSIEPVAGAGTLFSLLIPAELITRG